MASVQTPRSKAKLQRTETILREASKLFAAHGYSGVSLEEIGGAVGVSGPALYRHFNGKQALLSAVLYDASIHLTEGALKIAAKKHSPEEAMRELINFHVAFSIASSDVIRVQDQDISKLEVTDRDEVRRLQRQYVEIWMRHLAKLINADENELRLRVQATFGLLNSTPHAADKTQRTKQSTSVLLERMAYASLTA